MAIDFLSYINIGIQYNRQLKNKDFFEFKKFTVKHVNSSMKVGFDGILLGAWCDIDRDMMLLDVGTGTGLIALMIAQRNSGAYIFAIEPDNDSFKEALYNFEISPWTDRLAIEKIRLQNYAPDKKYDHIICNPPYFNSGIISGRKGRAEVRHTINITHEELLSYSSGLIKNHGKLSVILPYDEGNRFIDIAEKYNFGLSRICQVFTKIKTERLLIELKYNWSDEPVKNLLKVYDDSGKYSAKYLEIVKDFYLKLSV